MAKCIEHIKTQKVFRVYNEDAERLVTRGDYKYVPKHKWKSSGRAKLVRPKARQG